MKKRKSGCILFISSLASILGMHDIQAYTLCKSGVKGLTRSLSRDLGPYGIRVNSLNPGFVYTDMLAKTNLKTPERLEEIQNRTPLRGFAKEKDLGMAAAFLCSDAARFISGIDLVVMAESAVLSYCKAKKSRYSVSYLLFYLIDLILNNFLIFLPLALWMSYLLIPINLCNLILKALRSLSLTLRSLQSFLINALLFSSLYCVVLCILYLCFIFYQINFGESICSIIF